MKPIQDKLLKVARTTSCNAKEKIEEHKLSEMDLGMFVNDFQTSEKEDGTKVLTPEAQKKQKYEETKQIMPKFMRIEWSERRIFNKLGYILYKTLRFFNISFWQYFAPFYAIFFCFWIPNNTSDTTTLS